MFECQNCHLRTISIKDKFKAGYWRNIVCPNCHARLSDNPIVLGCLHFFLYVQMVAWFIGMFYMDHTPINFLYIALIWIVLDVINVTMVPLVVLKPKEGEPS